MVNGSSDLLDLEVIDQTTRNQVYSNRLDQIFQVLENTCFRSDLFSDFNLERMFAYMQIQQWIDQLEFDNKEQVFSLDQQSAQSNI